MREKNIKIVYILGPTSMDGSLISLQIILDGMIDLGCDIVILISNLNCNYDFIDYIKARGCVLESFEDETSVYPDCQLFGWQNNFVKFPWRLMRKLYRLSRSNQQVLTLIQKHNPDIVHTNVGVFQQGLRACNKLGIPHLWHLREYQTKDFGWTIMPSKSSFKRLLRTTNVVAITNDILEYFDLKSIKTAKAMWNGILPAASAVYVHEKKPYFLSANRISPEKRVEVAIKAFASIADKLPEHRLIIVGKSQNKSYSEKLAELVSSLSVGDRIEFHDFRPDVVNLMKDATALVVASNFEGLGRMTVEASFMGCLVLGRNTGGTKEILNATGGGYLFNSSEELKEQMMRVANIAGTEAYRKKALAAQRIAIDNFSNEQYCLGIFDMYKHIISIQTN
ncbi:glycosyltransferase [Flavobacterium sp. XS2P12]|uniref:glycosyltransferase n=1 Tax=Flavobacterium melibiosi TaxID=3398734 RepID=UPI003A86ADBB